MSKDDKKSLQTQKIRAASMQETSHDLTCLSLADTRLGWKSKALGSLPLKVARNDAARSASDRLKSNNGVEIKVHVV